MSGQNAKEELEAILTRGIGGLSSRFPWVLKATKTGSFKVLVISEEDKAILEKELETLKTTKVVTFGIKCDDGTKPDPMEFNELLKVVVPYLDPHNGLVVYVTDDSTLEQQQVAFWIRSVEKTNSIEEDAALLRDTMITVIADPAEFDE